MNAAVDMLAFVDRNGQPCLRVEDGDLTTTACGRAAVEKLFSDTMGRLTNEWWAKHGRTGRIPFAPDRNIHFVDVAKAAEKR